jgi:8-oxo-dGTP pyrophosphatase MutT (NUDIX family)
MKEGTPAWSVVTVLFRGPQQVLALARNFNPRDPAFPGGDSEVFDASPEDTATRELMEETGVEALELKLMDKWQGERGQPVFAFFVPRWRGPRLRTGAEGKPFWTRPERLVHRSATYGADAQRLLAKLGRVPDTIRNTG